MAQRYIGIDLGTHFVRVIELSGTPRNVAVTAVFEEPVVVEVEPHIEPDPDDEDAPPAPDIPRAQRVHHAHLDALARIAPKLNLRADMLSISAPPEMAVTTRIDLPVNDRKLVEQILPELLRGNLPVGDDDVVDYAVIGPARGEEKGFDSLVVSASASDVEHLLEGFDALDADPQLVVPNVLVEHHAAGYVNPSEAGVYAVVDLGAYHTSCTIMQSTSFSMARPILAGGDILSQALADRLHLSLEQAEDLKCARGFIAPIGAEADWAQQLDVPEAFADGHPVPMTEIAAALRNGLRPLIFGLRQTLGAYTMQFGVPVERIELVGGGARLRGLPQYLSMELGLPVERMVVRQPQLLASLPPSADPATLFGALAQALNAAQTKGEGLQLNLRRGRVAYKGGLYFLKEHLPAAVTLVAGLFFAIVFMVYSSFMALSAEHDQVEASLRASTESLFGTALMTADEVEGEVMRVRSFNAIPKRSAYYHLAAMAELVNRDTTGLGQVNEEGAFINEFEFTHVDIDTTRKTVLIEGSASSIETLNLIKRVLGRYKCFPRNIQENQLRTRNEEVLFNLKVQLERCTDD